MINKKLPEAFCWSKMGAEAGEKLERIIQRKEIERLANGGAFTWGVGTSLGNSLEELRKSIDSIPVVFTFMKGKAKKIDSHPKSLMLWLSAIDRNGNKFPLPEYSLLTSRGNTLLSNHKKKHYALICSSSASIVMDEAGDLNGGDLVNYKSGRKVGASQVTSVVRVDVESEQKRSQYRIGFTAEIAKEGQVILADCVPIRSNDIEKILQAAEEENVDSWKKAISELKSVARLRLRGQSQDIKPKQEQIQFKDIALA